MSDQTARAEDEAAKKPEKTPEAAAAAPEPTPSTALEREHAEMRDRLLRTLAGMENLRKRTEREVADARVHGGPWCAGGLLRVADSRRRALDALRAEGRSSAQAGIKALVEG